MQVSIGIPFYNNAATLADTIRSVFAQTFRDWELILIDDGSRDASLAIAQSVRDPRVRVVSDGQNRGLEYRLNQLVDLSRGAYIARMDADDMMHPARIEQQVRGLDQQRQINVLGTGLYTIDAGNRVLGMRGCQPLNLTPRGILSRPPLAHPTVMTRAAWSRRNRYSNAFTRAEDYELWCRTCADNPTQFGILPIPLLFYREHGSITLNKVLASHASVRKAIRKYGPALVGKAGTYRCLAESHAKTALWRIMNLLHLEQKLVERRSRELSPVAVAAAQPILDAILDTSVPGLQPASTTAFSNPPSIRAA